MARWFRAPILRTVHWGLLAGSLVGGCSPGTQEEASVDRQQEPAVIDVPGDTGARVTGYVDRGGLICVTLTDATGVMHEGFGSESCSEVVPALRWAPLMTSLDGSGLVATIVEGAVRQLTIQFEGGRVRAAIKAIPGTGLSIVAAEVPRSADILGVTAIDADGDELPLTAVADGSSGFPASFP